MSQDLPAPVSSLLDALERQEDLLGAARQYLQWLDTAEDGSQLPLGALVDKLIALASAQPAPLLGLSAQLIGYSSPYIETIEPALAPMIQRAADSYEGALPFAQRLAQAFEGYIPDQAEEDEDAIMARLCAEDEQGAAAWQQLGECLKGLELAASLDQRARQRLNASQALYQALEQHWPTHGPSARLLTLLHMIDGERIIVFDTQRRRAFELEAHGIVDEKQLHGLLIHALAQPLGLTPLEDEPLSILDGSGPHFTGAWLQGQWTIWSADALDGQLKLPTSAQDHDALMLAHYPVPSLVPRRQGRLVFVLGPTTTFESWTLMRRFELLRAKVELIQEVDPDQLLTIQPSNEP